MFVGYLWGIETSLSQFFVDLLILVCRLPMRDWNSFFWGLCPFPDVFVGYLWGIETYPSRKVPHSPKAFVGYLWGIETGFSRLRNWRSFGGFVGYLWGIETFDSLPPPFRIISRFVGYLWGIETTSSQIPPDSSPSFVGYLWGIETRLAFWRRFSSSSVCRLPMRDWNGH